MLALPDAGMAQSRSSSASPAAIRSAPPGIAATNDIAFSPDAARIVSFAKTDRVVVWDVASGKPLWTSARQSAYTPALDWGPGDGALIATGNRDGTVKLWAPDDGTLVRTLDGPLRTVNRVRFSPGGRYLAALNKVADDPDRGRLVVCRVADGTQVMQLRRPRDVGGLAWGASGTDLFTAEEDGGLYQWSVPEGARQGTWSLSNRLVTAAASSSSPLVAAGGFGDVVHRIDTARDTTYASLQQGSVLNRIAVDPAGTLVAGAGGDGVLNAWDAQNGTLRFSRLAHDAIAYRVAVAPDGRLVATSGADNYIRLWDARTGGLVRAIGGR
jgi:WD40 repeat protein